VGLDDSGSAEKRRATVRTGAVRLYFALLIAEREGVLVAEQYGFGHLFKAAAFLK
jgi:hypothetical protein